MPMLAFWHLMDNALEVRVKAERVIVNEIIALHPHLPECLDVPLARDITTTCALAQTH